MKTALINLLKNYGLALAICILSMFGFIKLANTKIGDYFESYIAHSLQQKFRNYKKKSLEFSDKITVIVGDNAVGKTNILEALLPIYVKYLQFP